MILTRKSYNCTGTAFVQGDSAGGSKFIEQTSPVLMFVYTHFNVPPTRITDLVRNVSDEKTY